MQQLLDTLKQCGYDPYFVQTRQEALELSKTFIKDGMSVGLGGSTTVSEIGLLDEIVNNKNITLFNQYENGISMEENTKRRREGMLTDLYVTGTNALTKDGKLVNADGSGNRVAALIFGPKKVLVVIGINKIVENLDEGFKRLMEVAAVKNVDRMNSKSIEMGKEPRHNLDNIANKFTYIKADVQNRISIIIVNEELGY
ncbi:lactate utilization protein [Arcobacter arenosus]|uniref:Lactate utilization protein n=1 Tax=Arcobacter arenosus TaxID=2576037 RepID=A0A5R8Y3E2_9BACT|nr:lactate utilization protein [Arcobacter arenosus]TLP40604.1 lactate utilization protein [Arcobacter arenosus]